MTKDKILIVGNWKMNLNVHDSSLYVNKLSKLIKVHRNIEVVIAPSMIALQSLSLQVNYRQFKLAAQNFYWRDFGSFTGEVSATQLRGVVQYGIVGHSERRHIFCEDDKDIRNKVQAALRNHIKPILCVGETALERNNNETKDVLYDQLIGGLANTTSDEISNIVIAYEPVWAIGTGDNASPDDVIEATKIIRNEIMHLYGRKAAQEVQIIYGGSINPDNSNEYLMIDSIDGLLVGTDSLNAHDFSSIIEKAYKLVSNGDEKYEEKK